MTFCAVNLSRSLLAAAVIVSAIVSGCRHGIEAQATPPLDANHEQRALVEAVNNLIDCTSDYTEAHLDTSLTGTELATAALSACSKFSDAIYSHAILSFYASFSEGSRPSDADRFAKRMKDSTEDQARGGVLQLIAAHSENRRKAQ